MDFRCSQEDKVLGIIDINRFLFYSIKNEASKILLLMWRWGTVHSLKRLKWYAIFFYHTLLTIFFKYTFKENNHTNSFWDFVRQKNLFSEEWKQFKNIAYQIMHSPAVGTEKQATLQSCCSPSSPLKKQIFLPPSLDQTGSAALF